MENCVAYKAGTKFVYFQQHDDPHFDPELELPQPELPPHELIPELPHELIPELPHELIPELPHELDPELELPQPINYDNSFRNTSFNSFIIFL